MRVVCLGSVVVCAFLAWAAAGAAQAGTGQAASQGGAETTAPQTASDVVRAMVLMSTTSAPPATLSFHNRDIVEFQATVLSRTPAMRAASVRRLLRDLVDRRQAGPVTSRQVGEAMVVSVGTVDVFALVPLDADPVSEPLADLARRATATLQIALDEAIESRAPRLVAQSVVWTLLAIVVVALLLRLVARGHRALVNMASGFADRELRKLRAGEEVVVRASRLPEYLKRGVTLVSVLVVSLIGYVWLTFVLNRFPYSRPWGEALRGFLLDRISWLSLGIVGAVPGLFSVLLIVAVARIAVKTAGLFFEAVEQKRLALRWLYPETVPTTRHLVTLLIWLFAAALAYPHFPASETDAFRGVSIFVGLMVSLGSSGIVNQLTSGVMLTYSRALRVGDFVRIGEVEATVTQLGILSTKVKTLRREEVTIPNAVLFSTITTNYSRLHQSEGVFAATSVTIGYDVPWRQVRALLLLAADRTTGIRRQPAPEVCQTGLRDFYAEYSLWVSLEDQASRVPILDRLHANIQDAFNEFGVQIMSPNYEADPQAPKVVPPNKWFAAPAAAPRPDEPVTAPM